MSPMPHNFIKPIVISATICLMLGTSALAGQVCKSTWHNQLPKPGQEIGVSHAFIGAFELDDQSFCEWGWIEKHQRLPGCTVLFEKNYKVISYDPICGTVLLASEGGTLIWTRDELFVLNSH